MDGTSSTFYYTNFNKNEILQQDFGVCSRNINLKETDGNLYWKMANRYSMKERLARLNKNIALQGEIIGFGIQGNPEKLQNQDLYLFNIWDIDNQRYMDYNEFFETLNSLNRFDGEKLKTVPYVDIIKLSQFETIQDIKKYSEGKSLNPETEREGIVFKSKELINGKIVSFKSISNNYLLKEK